MAIRRAPRFLAPPARWSHRAARAPLQETRHDTDHENIFRQESYFHWYGRNAAAPLPRTTDPPRPAGPHVPFLCALQVLWRERGRLLRRH